MAVCIANSEQFEMEDASCAVCSVDARVRDSTLMHVQALSVCQEAQLGRIRKASGTGVALESSRRHERSMLLQREIGDRVTPCSERGDRRQLQEHLNEAAACPSFGDCL